jgi:hypothetical protein
MVEGEGGIRQSKGPKRVDKPSEVTPAEKVTHGSKVSPELHESSPSAGEASASPKKFKHPVRKDPQWMPDER